MGEGGEEGRRRGEEENGHNACPPHALTLADRLLRHVPRAQCPCLRRDHLWVTLENLISRPLPHGQLGRSHPEYMGLRRLPRKALLKACALAGYMDTFRPSPPTRRSLWLL